MLLKLIYRISYRLRRGKVVLRIDRRCLIKDATTPPLKPSQCTKDCRAIRARHDEIKKTLDIKIEIRHSSDEIKSNRNMWENRKVFNKRVQY